MPQKRGCQPATILAALYGLGYQGDITPHGTHIHGFVAHVDAPKCPTEVIEKWKGTKGNYCKYSLYRTAFLDLLLTNLFENGDQKKPLSLSEEARASIFAAALSRAEGFASITKAW